MLPRKGSANPARSAWKDVGGDLRKGKTRAKAPKVTREKSYRDSAKKTGEVKMKRNINRSRNRLNQKKARKPSGRGEGKSKKIRSHAEGGKRGRGVHRHFSAGNCLTRFRRRVQFQSLRKRNRSAREIWVGTVRMGFQAKERETLGERESGVPEA